MKWGRIEVSAGFFLFFAAVLFLDRGGILLYAMTAALLHEFGHIFAAGLFGSRVDQIRLSLFGAEMHLTETLGISYPAEAMIHLAGPAVNALAAFLASWFGNILDSDPLLTFAGMSLLIGLINLLPIRALDGGNALEAIGMALTGRISPAIRVFETLIALAVLVCIFLFIVTFGMNVSLLILSAFLIPGGQRMAERPDMGRFGRGSSGRGSSGRSRGIVKRSEMM